MKHLGGGGPVAWQPQGIFEFLGFCNAISSILGVVLTYHYRTLCRVCILVHMRKMGLCATHAPFGSMPEILQFA